METVDPTLIRLLLQNGYVPVLTPPALGEEGVPINVDGDKLALELATALQADGLLFFSDTPGLLRDRHDESSLIAEIDASSPESALAAAAAAWWSRSKPRSAPLTVVSAASSSPTAASPIQSGPRSMDKERPCAAPLRNLQ